MTITREPWSSRADAPLKIFEMIAGEIETRSQQHLPPAAMVTGWRLFLLESEPPISQPGGDLQPPTKLEVMAEVLYHIQSLSKPMHEWNRGTIELTFPIHPHMRRLHR